MSNPRTRKTDRFLAILLTFMMVIGMLPVSVYAGPIEFPNNFTVTVKDENGTPVSGAAVTYTLRVDGEEKLSDQSTEPTNSNGIAAIDLSEYEENITAGNVTISVTVSKDPFFEDKTVQNEAVTDATGNIDIKLSSRTVTVTGTVNDHENNPVDGAAVEFSGAEMVNPVIYTGADGSFTLNYVPVCENGKLTITAPESVSDKYDSFTYNIPFSAAETVSCGILAFELKTYKVTFVSNAFGRFTMTESDDAITELTVKHGDDVSFRFVPSDGYDATITDGETPLVALEDIYTITDVREAHTVTAATTDIQAPVIEEISVQDESTWAQEKNIDVVVKDNAGIEQVRIYISLTEYADYEQLAAGGEAAASLPYKVSANGIYYVYAVDAANNFAKDSVEVKTVDIDAPAVDGFTPIPQGPSKTPRYEFTVTDTQSGIASVQYYKFGKEDDKQDADADDTVEAHFQYHAGQDACRRLFAQRRKECGRNADAQSKPGDHAVQQRHEAYAAAGYARRDGLQPAEPLPENKRPDKNGGQRLDVLAKADIQNAPVRGTPDVQKPDEHMQAAAQADVCPVVPNPECRAHGRPLTRDQQQQQCPEKRADGAVGKDFERGKMLQQHPVQRHESPASKDAQQRQGSLAPCGGVKRRGGITHGRTSERQT